MTNRIFRALAVAMFVISLPILITTTNVKLLMLDPAFYDYDQSMNGVLATSGLPASTLQSANNSLASYFEQKNASLDSELKRQGLPTDFFSERESNHLSDVRSLVWMVIGAQQLTLGYVLLFLAASFLFKPRIFLQNVRGPLAGGAALTLALLVAFGVLSQIDFSGLFLMFHLVSFSNDLWMLDPARDNLLKMYPEAFWLFAAVTMAAYSAAAAAAIGIVSGLLHWRRLGLT